MADYIYLLENRLSSIQKAALQVVKEVARSKGSTVFLVGGAVRDLTSGSPVQDLDVVVQGNALHLKDDLQAAGVSISGEYEAGQALFLRFANGVRMEVGSTLSVTYPKPGQPVAKSGTILEDLRRRDFTANAMALSLNEGSYGLLMDPLNGVADIENRQLRLVSNYGFIEEPVRMVRAARLMARLGWTLEEKTQTRYETGKQEDYISTLQEFQRGYELEEIVHEEDPLRVMKGLEAEGWMKVLAPSWTSAKVNVAELEKLRETQTQLQMQGIHPDPASAQFPLLTAKLQPAEIEELKKSFPRAGFTAEIDSLEAAAKELTTQLSGKGASTPSQVWKLLTSANPEAVLWVAYSTKSGTLQAKFKSFYTEWPQARQKIPFALLQEMRITPELPEYAELLEKLFFELMDGHLGTTEEMKAFLEPYSPPAPPPPVNMRRPRTAKKEAKPAKGRARKVVALKSDEDDEDEDGGDVDTDDDDDDDDDVIDLPAVPDDDEDLDLDVSDDDDLADDDDADDEDSDEPPVKKPAKGASKSASRSLDDGDDDLEPAAPAKPAKAAKAAKKASSAVDASADEAKGGRPLKTAAASALADGQTLRVVAVPAKQVAASKKSAKPASKPDVK